MADKYQAPDGTIFDTANAAQAYADAKVKEAAELNAARQRNDNARTSDLNRMIRAYNESNWDEIIKINDLSNGYPSMYTSRAMLMVSTAVGKKGDYAGAYGRLFRAIKDYTGNISFETITSLKNKNDEFATIFKNAEAAAKQAWEKANGRAMTDEDYKQELLKVLEEEIKYFQHLVDIGRDVVDQRDPWISSWEQIAGKRYRGSSSSSSSTSGYADQRNGFVSFLFGLVGAVGSVLGIKLFIIPRINLVDEWILVISICLYLIVPLVALGVTYSAWRNKRNILFIIMLALIIPGYIGLIGTKAMSGKTPKAKTETTQGANTNPSAEITKNVNFRKGPSTNDEVIRQLKQGDIVILTGEVSGGWTQVTRDGEKGWVSNEYLKVWEK